MKYQFTNFKPSEQQIMNDLRAQGKFIYALRNVDDLAYTIEKRVYVNNIGFLITDEELPLRNGVLTDVEFSELNGEEVFDLR